jgi:hypothetical protein
LYLLCVVLLKVIVDSAVTRGRISGWRTRRDGFRCGDLEWKGDFRDFEPNFDSGASYVSL